MKNQKKIYKGLLKNWGNHKKLRIGEELPDGTFKLSSHLLEMRCIRHCCSRDKLGGRKRIDRVFGIEGEKSDGVNEDGDKREKIAKEVGGK